LEALDVGIATFLAGLLILTVWRATSELPAGKQWPPRVGSIAFVSFLMGFSGVLAASGYLRDFASRPPRFLVLMLPTMAVTIAVALSPLGRRLAIQVPVWGLVGFQSFRVLVEILLWGLHRLGALPVQMTFEGYNFDILTGLSAIALAWAARNGRASARVLWIWNLCGLALLINVITIAALSIPGPLRTLHGPPNTVVTRLPFVWVPCVMVQAALFGHILLFRALRRNPGAARPTQPSQAATTA
jgi:hypothetical protein